MAVNAGALARVGTALADESRRKLLLALLDGPAWPSQLAERLGMSRSNVSNHLSCLRGCGLVRTVPMGRRVRYELADPRLSSALAELSALVLLLDPAEGTAEPCASDAYRCRSAELDTTHLSVEEARHG